jgi:exonuclease SbcC
MSNLPIKFLSVEIRNFRGVPDTLQIPLDAPLTIIHAANGTGKSTICYALEWLLTSKVDDLPNTTIFSCQWGTGDTSVSADCLINGEPYKLERINEKAWITKQGVKRKQIKDAALLALLTPASVTGSSPQAKGRARRDWLRNCRWLYANSLALLVDNSKSEQRQQIFADILGLGHLTSMLSNLKEYRGELPSIRGLETKLGNLDEEIHDLEKQLTASLYMSEYVAVTLSSVLEVFPDHSFTGELQQDFKVARLQVTKLKQHAQRNKNILGLILEGWSEYESSQRQLEIGRSSLISLTQVSASVSEEHRQLAEQLSTVDIKLAEGRRNADWAMQRLNIINDWEAISSEPVVAQLFLQSDLGFQKLQQSFVEFGWPSDKQRNWLSSIEYLIQNKSTLIDLIQQKKDLVNNPVQPPSNIVQIHQLADEARQARVKAQAELDAFSSILDRLKALGHEAAHSLSSGVCPLCDYDWETGDMLRKQLSGTSLTPELRAVSRRLTEAQSAEQACLSNVKIANLQKTSHDAYLARVQHVNMQLESIENKTSYQQIMNQSDFAGFDANNFSYLLARIKAAIGAKNISIAVTEVEVLFQQTSSPIASLGVLKARELLEQYRKYFQAQMDEFTAVKPGIVRSMNDKLEIIQAKTRESNQVNASIAMSSEVVNRFEGQWKDVVGVLPISQDLHTAAQEKVDAELRRVEEYDKRLRECEPCLTIDSGSELLTRIQSERSALNGKLEAGRDYILRADNAISHYAEHVRDATVSSLAPLLGPATELFSRMHANEVYHQLSVSGDDLKWMVLAEGHETPLEAQEKLSQGQRQDLALSLYLARAKNTGGSFFLDEPIAHLDDLNRVAMLDIFRLAATSMPNMNLILTTASDTLARHLGQKFSSIQDRHLLNTIFLEGNPRTGVKATITSNMSVGAGGG